MAFDLAQPLRAAIIGQSSITTLLTAYKGSFPVFTRRPIDPDSPYPLIAVSPDVTKTDEDGISDERPIIIRDISIYGRNDTPARYRAVETIAYLVHDLFQRRWQSITVTGWKVVTINATGPQAAPVDDEQTVGRLVSLTIRLAKP